MAPDNLDCDDNDANRSPNLVEQCDGIDNNCDGVTGPQDTDGDADGFAPCQGDCDDSNGDSYPGASEICDGFDNNCDGDLDTANLVYVGQAPLGLTTWRHDPRDRRHSRSLQHPGPGSAPRDHSPKRPGFDDSTAGPRPHRAHTDHQRRPPGGADFNNTVFDDEAFVHINAGLPPYSGPFSPEQTLSAFDGFSTQGVWTLLIDDDLASAAGLLNTWELRFQVDGDADFDMDGSLVCGDCDDNDPSAVSGGVELCKRRRR